MIELLNSLEAHAKKQLEVINEHLERKGHFVCARQIDDLNDLLSAVHHIEALKAMPSVK